MVKHLRGATTVSTEKVGWRITGLQTFHDRANETHHLAFTDAAVQSLDLPDRLELKGTIWLRLDGRFPRLWSHVGRTEGSVDLLCLHICKRRTRSTWNVAAWLGNRKIRESLKFLPLILTLRKEIRKHSRKRRSTAQEAEKRIYISNLDPGRALVLLPQFGWTQKEERGKGGLDEGLVVGHVGDRNGRTKVLFLQCIPSLNHYPRGHIGDISLDGWYQDPIRIKMYGLWPQGVYLKLSKSQKKLADS